MLQKESLNCCEYTARPAFLLNQAVADRLVEEESLHPAVMDMTFAVLEQQMFDASSLFGRDRHLYCIHSNFAIH